MAITVIVVLLIIIIKVHIYADCQLKMYINMQNICIYIFIPQLLTCMYMRHILCKKSALSMYK